MVYGRFASVLNHWNIPAIVLFNKKFNSADWTNRKTKFLHSFSVEQYAKLNCYLFCLCLSFLLKVKKRYLFLKKKTGIFSFRVNDILTSILSTLHPFLTLPNDVLKRKRITFFGFKKSHERGKKVPFLQLEVMLLNVRKRYLFKNIK